VSTRRNGTGLVLLTIGLILSPAFAQESPPAKSTPKSDPPVESLSRTHHSVTVSGAKIDYEATAGNLVLKTEEGKATSSVFFIAYTKLGEEAARRPVMFTFNGGPGSSSVWLHMGAFGPRRVPVGDVGEPIVPPYRLSENAHCLLDVTDLVFIDPVSTGYSRPAPGQDGKEFHGVQQDIRSVGEFIRLYLTRFGRWDSPRFVAGESYGTTRAAGLSGHLPGQGIDLNGVILISAVLNFQTLRFDPGNDLPYPLFLPSYAATAWYHGKLANRPKGPMAEFLDEVRKFAADDYATALMKGRDLSSADRAEIVRKLAQYTGLSEEYVARSKLRIDISRFRKELLRDANKTAGRFDSRFTASALDPVSAEPDGDPSYTAVQGPYTALVNSYLRNDLKVEKDIPYEILTGRVQPWDYGSARNRYLNVAPTLREALVRNPQLRVLVCNGYYDLATPFFATEYTFNHMELDEAQVGRVQMTYYDAGHMMYVHKPDLEKLKKDVATFIRAAVPAAR
jgi:carboxypeptidase C (cathepsin A)